MTELLRVINEWCEHNSTRFIIVLDEAQYMRFSNIRYDGVLAWAYDNLGRVTFIVTGSEVGVLRDFLRVKDPEAPLFGKYIKEVYVDRFSRDASLNFLRRGFAELGVAVSEYDLVEVYEHLDEVVGWLTLTVTSGVLRDLAIRRPWLGSSMMGQGSCLVNLRP